MSRETGCEGGKRHLKIAHLNIRSLNTGFDEMCSLVGDFGFDVFGVTETWLHPDTPSSSYTIPGYSMLRSDRQHQTPGHRGGGGVAVYIRDDIMHEPYTLPDHIDPGVEFICTILRLKGVKLGLCVVYRPPHLRYTHLGPLI